MVNHTQRNKSLQADIQKDRQIHSESDWFVERKIDTYRHRQRETEKIHRNK